MTNAPILSWHICISGFTQRENSLHGIVRLWRDLHGKLESAESVVSLRTWNSRWADLAEHILLIQQNQGQAIRIAVYAYSYGAGWGLVQFAKQLRRRGLWVDVAVLADPVYRSPWLLFRWLAMTSWRQVTIPSNVKLVRWFYQRQNLPQSQGVVAENCKQTLITEGQELLCDHEYADDSLRFHESCHAAAEALWSA